MPELDDSDLRIKRYRVAARAYSEAIAEAGRLRTRLELVAKALIEPELPHWPGFLEPGVGPAIANPNELPEQGVKPPLSEPPTAAEISAHMEKLFEAGHAAIETWRELSDEEKADLAAIGPARSMWRFGTKLA